MTLNLQESFGHVMGALPRVRRSRIKFIVYGFELKLGFVQLLGSAIARLGLGLNFGKVLGWFPY